MFNWLLWISILCELTPINSQWFSFVFTCIQIIMKTKSSITAGKAKSKSIIKAGNALSMTEYAMPANGEQKTRPAIQAISDVPNIFLKTMMKRTNKATNKKVETSRSMNWLNGLWSTGLSSWPFIFIINYP
jgi:hypothetical protein